MNNIRKCTFHGGHNADSCKHATKWSNLRLIIEKSIELWMTHRWIVEHMPRLERYFYPEETEAGLKWNDLFEIFKTFVKETKTLQDEFKGKIKILVWMETEMLWPNAVQDINKLRQEHELDYLVWSVHHVYDIPIDFDIETRNEAVKKAWSEQNLQRKYFWSVLENIRNCKPEVIWHLDLIKLWSNENNENFDPSKDDVIVSLVDQIISEVVSYWWLFEVNSRAYKKWLTEPYPSSWIMKKILEKWWELTVWDDSHWIDDIWFKYNETIKYIKENWFNNIVALEKIEDIPYNENEPMSRFKKNIIKLDYD